jgi:hypothetical protein
VALGFTDVEQVHVMLSLLLVLESEEAKQVDAWNSEIVSAQGYCCSHESLHNFEHHKEEDEAENGSLPCHWLS